MQNSNRAPVILAVNESYTLLGTPTALPLANLARILGSYKFDVIERAARR
jgi:hypothetical protein